MSQTYDVSPMMSAPEPDMSTEPELGFEQPEGNAFAQAALWGRVEGVVDAGENAALALEALRGLDGDKAGAVRDMLAMGTGQDPSVALNGLQGADRAAAEAYLAGDQIGGALADLAGAQGTIDVLGIEIATVDPKRVRRTLEALDPDEIRTLRERAAADPALEQVLLASGQLFDDAIADGEAADEALAQVEPGAWEGIGVDPKDPTALASMSALELNEAIESGVVDRDAVLSLARRNGMDPAAFAGLEHLSDPDRERKDAGSKAKLIADLIETDRHGAQQEAGWEGPAQLMNNMRLDALSAEIAAAGDQMDPAKLEDIEKRYRALSGQQQSLFNDRMDTLETAAEVGTVAKDGLKWASGKLVWAATAVKTGGNLKAAGMAEAGWSGVLDGLEEGATEYFVEDADLGDAALSGAKKTALTATKGVADTLSGGSGLVEFGFDFLDNVLEDFDGDEEAFERRLAGRGEYDPKSLENLLASNAAKTGAGALLDGAADKLGGDSFVGSILAGVGGHNATHIAEGTIDEVSDRAHEGKDLDGLGALGEVALDHAKSFVDGRAKKSWVEHIFAPAAESARDRIGDDMEDDAEADFAKPSRP